MKICIDSKHEGVGFTCYQYSHTSSRKNNFKHILNNNMTAFFIDVNNVSMNQERIIHVESEYERVQHF